MGLRGDRVVDRHVAWRRGRKCGGPEEASGCKLVAKRGSALLVNSNHPTVWCWSLRQTLCNPSKTIDLFRIGLRVILVHICVKPQMRLDVCHRVGPFWVSSGSISMHVKGFKVSININTRINNKRRISVWTRMLFEQEFQHRLLKNVRAKRAKVLRAKRGPLQIQQTHLVTHI